MGLQHSTYIAYGFEIPTTTDFDALDAVLADQPDADRLGRIHHQYLGDFERLFLLAACTEVEENTCVPMTADHCGRPELGGWITALHDIAVRLGHKGHSLPTWLVLHDHS
ncbi:hypothetical protein [Streptomyces scabiei]|uniref:hypothetical protein n=1 Tax=Streptomyces scabiei TaxID=1930 RepID=UPI0038F72CC9